MTQVTLPVISRIVKDVFCDTHGKRQHIERFIAFAGDMVIGVSYDIEKVQADVRYTCALVGIEVPESVVVWDQD